MSTIINIVDRMNIGGANEKSRSKGKQNFYDVGTGI